MAKPSRDAVKEAAEMTGGKTGKTQVVDAKKLKAFAPDLFEEVEIVKLYRDGYFGESNTNK